MSKWFLPSVEKQDFISEAILYLFFLIYSLSAFASFLISLADFIFIKLIIMIELVRAHRGNKQSKNNSWSCSLFCNKYSKRK